MHIAGWCFLVALSLFSAASISYAIAYVWRNR